MRGLISVGSSPVNALFFFLNEVEGRKAKLPIPTAGRGEAVEGQERLRAAPHFQGMCLGGKRPSSYLACSGALAWSNASDLARIRNPSDNGNTGNSVAQKY